MNTSVSLDRNTHEILRRLRFESEKKARQYVEEQEQRYQTTIIKETTGLGTGFLVEVARNKLPKEAVKPMRPVSSYIFCNPRVYSPYSRGQRAIG